MDILNSETYKVAVTIVRDFSSIISMLSAGFGAVVGLYVTNKWQDRRLLLQQQKEDARKERERTMNLKKEVYLEYLEILERQLKHIANHASVQDWDMLALIKEYTELSRLNLRLHLIAQEPLLIAAHESRNLYVKAAQTLAHLRQHYDVIKDRRNEIIASGVNDPETLALLQDCQSKMHEKFLVLFKQCEIHGNQIRGSLKKIIAAIGVEIGSNISEKYISQAFAPTAITSEDALSKSVEDLQALAYSLYTPKNT